MKLSGYPTIPVLKTTSPAASVCAPNDCPVSWVPSFNVSVSVCGSEEFIAGILARGREKARRLDYSRR